jgi:hypothetical protein
MKPANLPNWAAETELACLNPVLTQIKETVLAIMLGVQDRLAIGKTALDQLGRMRTLAVYVGGGRPLMKSPHARSRLRWLAVCFLTNL